ncbi:hypothetical protein GCM10022247_69030 [Allokutzneria multivorans]|uniref:Gram-positive cocci surface proteins LPxTG domain-containing protein n=1 Tax=Allokutzneria multivorans TaxID=1142134 RepID=A0ABP7U0X2_9PSEU
MLLGDRLSRLLLVLPVALLGLAPAASAAPAPEISADSPVAAGERIIVRGKGFQSTERITLGTWAVPGSSDAERARTITTSTKGTFAAELEVRTDFAVAPRYEIRAVGADGTAALAVPVTAPTSTPPVTTTPVPAAPAAPAGRAAVLAAAGTPKLTASKTTGLAQNGEKITVRGEGYDVNKGIYVAICVDNGPGKAPSPCLGGADMSGGQGGSVWISSNPPPYGKDLAKPYGPGGSFSVELITKAKDTNADCLTQRCAVVSRNDHTRSGDRSQDVIVPITFTTGASSPAPVPVPTTAVITGAPAPSPTPKPEHLASTGTEGVVPLSLAAAVLLLAGAGLLVASRRRAGQ